MVWYNGGSALEKAVERHNSGGDIHERECGCASQDVNDRPCPASEAEECNCSEPRCYAAPKCCGRHNEPQGGLLTSLTKDRDFLLLAAVMMILMHEKADKKLILALAFVLFS